MSYGHCDCWKGVTVCTFRPTDMSIKETPQLRYYPSKARVGSTCQTCHMDTVISRKGVTVCTSECLLQRLVSMNSVLLVWINLVFNSAPQQARYVVTIHQSIFLLMPSIFLASAGTSYTNQLNKKLKLLMKCEQYTHNSTLSLACLLPHASPRCGLRTDSFFSNLG